MTQYQGGCHCGNVRFEADVDLAHVMTCNCSHCQAKGFMLTFVPADNFRLLKGEDAQTEYLFNKRAIQHLFCSTCGVQSFGRGQMPDGTPTVAVNVRCLDGVDLETLEPQKVDGRSF